MRLNAGIITDKLIETKLFYTEKLDFKIIWEADWFILLSTPNGQDTISFLVSDHPTQSLANFKKPFKMESPYKSEDEINELIKELNLEKNKVKVQQMLKRS